MSENDEKRQSGTSAYHLFLILILLLLSEDTLLILKKLFKNDKNIESNENQENKNTE